MYGTIQTRIMTVGIVCFSIASLFLSACSTSDVTQSPPKYTLPIAIATPLDKKILLGSTVQLDGGISYDPKGQDRKLTFSWGIQAKPWDSDAELDDPTSVSPSFIADKEGDYVVKLTVENQLGEESKPTYVIYETVKYLSEDNLVPVTEATSNTGPPVAVIFPYNNGYNTTIETGEAISLTGRFSYENTVRGYGLSYHWKISSKPYNSNPILTDPTSMNPTFVADKQGYYTIELIVENQNGVESKPDTIGLTVGNTTESKSFGEKVGSWIGNFIVQIGEMIAKLAIIYVIVSH